MKEVMIRMKPDLIARADAYARDMAKRTGLTVSRSDVCRMALVKMLEAEGVEEAPVERPAPKPPEKKAKKAESRIDSAADIDALPNPFS